MKTSALLGSVALAFLPSTSAAPSQLSNCRARTDVSVERRALSNAANPYAPVHVSCPANRPSIRGAATLSPEEVSWLDTRREKSLSGLKEFFGHVEIGCFDALDYLDTSDSSSLPNVAIAISGGGMRAMLNGAGALKAFDSRTEGTAAQGQLGGLLQSATYVSALSGGSWLLSSVFMNNFTTISALQDTFWDFSSASILEGPATMEPTDFWGNVTAQVKAKRAAGFTTTDADIWGRAEGYYFLNSSHGGVDIHWSSITKTQAFQHGDMPLPLVVVDGQSFADANDEPGEDKPIYEVSPWEFGTYDNNMYGFAPLEYLGTRFVNGQVPENETCVRGFDSAGFITGTSSDIWNENGADIAATLRAAIGDVSTNTTEGALEVELLSYILEEVMGAVSSNNTATSGPAAYEPNPFYGYNANTSPFANTTRLTVVDGGEDEENIPLNPLIQRKRDVDVIFAIDSNNNDAGYKWPTGESLIATYERTLAGYANDTSFPSIPDGNTFVNLGLISHPTFFGCNSSNMTTPAPLIVYLPNHPVTYMSNTTTTDTTFNTTARDAMITNGFNVATQANGTLDNEWTTCVGCAVLSRSFDRTNTPVPAACEQCFQRYCWNGTLDTSTPAVYDPSVIFPSGL
ncbi:lysophospholipase phospholipase [Aspergillus costaricaensis CBS 115574]|uniref:Lysophospholipase phospholipase n=1 Tax=Aspergillus costaricaensis CBS 115574 TaxID=1448317 RepID=A0ACD1IJY4_9EURO|nr:lysophospholipase phospholipase [Aspergillus costaricaensis CBS 115574]RAK90711.1 lysophospholipase phospholipase [Aspergillus costaricaensis CBS 115574]